MANVPISDLSALSSTDVATGDQLVIVDISEALDADKTKNITLASLFGWQDYTVTWTGNTTDPAIGNGTLTGRYCQVGKKVTCTVSMTTGSTTSYGSGFWRFSLPATVANQVVRYTGAWSAYDDSLSSHYTGTCEVLPDASAIIFFRRDGGGQTLTSAVPFTWADGDQLFFTITYEAA